MYGFSNVAFEVDIQIVIAQSCLPSTHVHMTPE